MYHTRSFAVNVVRARAQDVVNHLACTEEMVRKIELILEETDDWTLADAANVAATLEVYLHHLNRTV